VRSSISARSGDLVAQPVHRHQQEAEIQRHRQEHQYQHQHRLERVETDKRGVAADMEHVTAGADGIDGNNDNGDDARKPGAGIDAAILPRQQQLQHQRKRHRLTYRIDENPHRHAVVAKDEERQAGEACPGDQRGTAPTHGLVVKPLDAHCCKAGGENQHGAAGQQRHQRIRSDDAHHRQRRTAGSRERRAGPELRRLEFGVATRDIGPDQAQREKIDDEHRPQRRNAQHRECRTHMVPPPLFSNSPPMTVPLLAIIPTASRIDRRPSSGCD
jgi:hypothetical protein